jgi:hypothetical protein
VKQLDYFREHVPDGWKYLAVPKALLEGSAYRGLSVEAKLLFAAMLNRVNLSEERGWKDAAGRIYIIYTSEEAGELLGCSPRKTVRVFGELDERGLIERRRRGQGKPSLIFLRDIFADEQTCQNDTSRDVKDALLEVPETQFRTCHNDTSGDNDAVQKCPNDTSRDAKNALLEVPETQFKTCQNDTSGGCDEVQTCQNDTSRDAKNAILEVPKWHAINLIRDTLIEDPDLSNQSGQPAAENLSERTREALRVKERLDKELDVPMLLRRFPDEVETVEGIVDLMAEVLSDQSQREVWINHEQMPLDFVQMRLRKLTGEDICYVIEQLHGVEEISNPRQYLLAMLYNAHALASVHKVSTGMDA